MEQRTRVGIGAGVDTVQLRSGNKERKQEQEEQGAEPDGEQGRGPIHYLRSLLFRFLQRQRSKSLSNHVVPANPGGQLNAGGQLIPGVPSSSVAPSRADALSLSILNKVPLDILVCIMDFLPPESAVVFSLSCMHLKRLLGTQHFSKVASTEGTLALLNLLVIDLPEQIVCYACKRLHNMENLQRYSSSTYSPGRMTWLPACVLQDRLSYIIPISNLFGATAFKMAIKRHHQRPECTELLKMMSSKEAKTRKDGDYVRQFREECRIVQGYLMYRSQSAYISRRNRSTPEIFGHTPPAEEICPHHSLDIACYNSPRGLNQCQKCRTEFRIDRKYYNGHGLVMLLTKWKDLGNGPESEAWTQHLLSESTARLLASMSWGPFNPRTSVKVEDRPRPVAISSAFGDGDEFEFDSLLTPENEAELFRLHKKFQQTMMLSLQITKPNLKSWDQALEG